MSKKKKKMRSAEQVLRDLQSRLGELEKETDLISGNPVFRHIVEEARKKLEMLNRRKGI